MGNSVDEHPIEAQIADERKERQRQEAACIEAIKEVHAAGPTIKIGTPAQWARRTRGRVWLVASPPILKYSSGGVFLRAGMVQIKKTRHAQPAFTG
ncbi:hypothetical protein ACFS07_10765 [Undibacterium arcticum]